MRTPHVFHPASQALLELALQEARHLGVALTRRPSIATIDSAAQAIEQIVGDVGIGIEAAVRDGDRDLGERVALLSDLARLDLVCMCAPGVSELDGDDMYVCTGCDRIAVASTLGHLVLLAAGGAR